MCEPCIGDDAVSLLFQMAYGFRGKFDGYRAPNGLGPVIDNTDDKLDIITDERDGRRDKTHLQIADRARQMLGYGSR